MRRTDGAGDRLHGPESEGSVGGIAEVCDGFVGEGVAGTTYIMLSFQPTASGQLE